jgi:hypothetical protein
MSHVAGDHAGHAAIVKTMVSSRHLRVEDSSLPDGKVRLAIRQGNQPKK